MLPFIQRPLFCSSPIHFYKQQTYALILCSSVLQFDRFFIRWGLRAEVVNRDNQFFIMIIVNSCSLYLKKKKNLTGIWTGTPVCSPRRSLSLNTLIIRICYSLDDCCNYNHYFSQRWFIIELAQLKSPSQNKCLISIHAADMRTHFILFNSGL